LSPAPTIQHIAESAPASSAPSPTEQVTPRHYRPPFNDGSFGAAIGNTVAQFPDLIWLLTAVLTFGLIILVERLDESPKFQSIFKKKQ
jgi:hypothetical protein